MVDDALVDAIAIPGAFEVAGHSRAVVEDTGDLARV